MLDLTTTYLGLHLKNPLVASASPLSRKIDSARRLEDAGAAAIVMYSLFEEQITHDSHELNHYLERGTHAFAESLSYFPDLEHYNLGPEPYLEHLHSLKQAVDIPVIGSLNGISSGGWLDYAHKIEQAGADALELNIYYLPTDVDLGARCTIQDQAAHCSQTQSVLDLAAPYRQTLRRGRRKRAGALQPLLPAGF